MKITAYLTTRLAGSLALAAVILAAPPAVAQSADDIRAVMRVESDGQPPMDMEYSLGQGTMRLDMSEEMSIISTTGDNPSMLMVQHAEQRYIEWGPEQLEMMRQMLQRVGGAAPDTDVFDPTTMQFEPTGQTQQIGDWNAFEVLMQGSDGQQGSLWLTTDAQIGLFEISLRAAEAASMLQNPMTGGGGGGSQQFLQYRSLAEAQGLPEGRVVRIVSDTEDGGATITLVDLTAGPLPGDTFDPPAGYEQMQMPSIPGLPE